MKTQAKGATGNRSKVQVSPNREGEGEGAGEGEGTVLHLLRIRELGLGNPNPPAKANPVLVEAPVACGRGFCPTCIPEKRNPAFRMRCVKAAWIGPVIGGLLMRN